MYDAIKRDINALVNSNREASSLPAVEPVGGHPARRGRATYASPQVAAGGGGIAGPLNELKGRREYHETGYTSSDGLFFLPAVKHIEMEDADGQIVVFNYANPSA